MTGNALVPGLLRDGVLESERETRDHTIRVDCGKNSAVAWLNGVEVYRQNDTGRPIRTVGIKG